MKIYYWWVEWAYSHIVGNFYWEKLGIKDVEWVKNFKEVFEEIIKWNYWIIPIENSYAGSVYENFFNLSKYDVKIYDEYYLDINHCLVSTSSNISSIKKVFSHYQALMQCENYLNKNNLTQESYLDTAWSAAYIKELQNSEFWAICSEFAGEIYWLNILEKNIEDQSGNTTRFFLVGQNWLNLWLEKKWKISLIFKAKSVPAVLYKCLGAFATRNINLTKIESLPAKENPFEYMFWIDLDGRLDSVEVKWALEELKFFTTDIRILWDY